MATASALAYNIFLSFSDTTAMIFICKYLNVMGVKKAAEGYKLTLSCRVNECVFILYN